MFLLGKKEPLILLLDSPAQTTNFAESNVCEIHSHAFTAPHSPVFLFIYLFKWSWAGKPGAPYITFTPINHLVYLIWEDFSLSQSCISHLLPTLYFIEKKFHALSHYYVRSGAWHYSFSSWCLTDFRYLCSNMAKISATLPNFYNKIILRIFFCSRTILSLKFCWKLLFQHNL